MHSALHQSICSINICTNFEHSFKKTRALTICLKVFIINLKKCLQQYELLHETCRLFASVLALSG